MTKTFTSSAPNNVPTDLHRKHKQTKYPEGVFTFLCMGCILSVMDNSTGVMALTALEQREHSVLSAAVELQAFVSSHVDG